MNGSNGFHGATSGAAAGAAAGAADAKKDVPKGGYMGPVVWEGGVTPTVTPFPNFDAKGDAQTLYKAMKGLGTNEATLINVLCRRTLKQRMAIREAYKQHMQKDLEKHLASETSGNFCRVLKALVRQPAERDAKFLHNAIKGMGTDDTLLIELLCSKDSTQLSDIKVAYSRMFAGHTLEKDIAGDTSGDYKKLLLGLLSCKRPDNSVPVNIPHAEADAKALFKAGENRLGTDEAEFIEIFTTRNFPQLVATFDCYQKICKFDICESVARETSFNFKVALQAIVDFARSPAHYFARRLFNALDGLGTHDLGLIFLIIDRAEIDLQTIKDLFSKLYGKELAVLVKKDTSGDYQKALLTLLGI